MKRYTVFLLVPYVRWESVEAENEHEAIEKCTTDHDEPDGFSLYHAVED
jgi:hypothetical protein